MECLLPYLCMVTVPHIMVGLERMLDYRGVGLVRFHCTTLWWEIEVEIFLFHNLAQFVKVNSRNPCKQKY